MHDLVNTQSTQHQEPQEHNGPERTPNDFCPKPLKNEQKQKYDQYNTQNQVITRHYGVFQSLHTAQTFYSRSYRDRRGNDTIRQQGAGTYYGRYHQFFTKPPYKSVKGKDTTFTMVISLQRYKY